MEAREATNPAQRNRATTRPVVDSSLSPPRRRLLKLMRDLQFGRIEGLQVREGEPQLDPPPLVIHDLKFGAPVPAEPPSEGTCLKSEVRELLRMLDRIANGEISLLEFRHGLPFRVNLPVDLAG